MSRKPAIYTGAAALFIAILYFAPSLFLRSYVDAFLSAQGMEAEGLEEIHFNVFNLGLETGPVSILHQGKTVADLDGLALFLNLGPLVRQRIDVTGARLDGLNITLKQDEGGTIAVKDLPDIGSGNADSAPLAWLFGLSSLELANATVNLELDQISGPLIIDTIRIENLKTWTPETPGSLNLKARFYDGAIAGTLSVRPDLEVLDLDFDLDIDNFPLDQVKLDVPVSGRAGLALTGDIAAADHFQVRAAGEIGFAGASYEFDGRTIKLAQADIDVNGLLIRQDSSAGHSGGVFASVDGVRFDAPGTLLFTDETLAEPQSFELTINALEIGSVDSAKPDAPTEISFASTLGEYTSLDVAGWVKPLAPNGPDFDLTGTLAKLELPLISEYGAASVGTHLRAGRLDVDFEGVAKAGAIEAHTDWLIQRIELEELDEFDKAKISEQTNVPIEKAVDLLQDKDGNITLKIPIAGSLDDPEFDLSGTISKAIGKAVKGAVVATLKIAFPFALLADVAGKDGALAFDPVAFDAGSTALTDGPNIYVSSIAELLNTRPNVTLLVCGVAAKADLANLRMPAHEQALAERQAAAVPFMAAIQSENESVPPEVTAVQELEATDPMAAALSEVENEALTMLAQNRRDVVRDILVDTHGVEKDRIFDCRSKVSVEDDAPPRVDVQL